jgi:hypothetical protein
MTTITCTCGRRTYTAASRPIDVARLAESCPDYGANAVRVSTDNGELVDDFLDPRGRMIPSSLRPRSKRAEEQEVSVNTMLLLLIAGGMGFRLQPTD